MNFDWRYQMRFTYRVWGMVGRQRLAGRRQLIRVASNPETTTYRYRKFEVRATTLSMMQVINITSQEQ